MLIGRRASISAANIANLGFFGGHLRMLSVAARGGHRRLIFLAAILACFLWQHAYAWRPSQISFCCAHLRWLSLVTILNYLLWWTSHIYFCEGHFGLLPVAAIAVFNDQLLSHELICIREIHTHAHARTHGRTQICLGAIQLRNNGEHKKTSRDTSCLHVNPHYNIYVCSPHLAFTNNNFAVWSCGPLWSSMVKELRTVGQACCFLFLGRCWVHVERQQLGFA